MVFFISFRILSNGGVLESGAEARNAEGGVPGLASNWVWGGWRVAGSDAGPYSPSRGKAFLWLRPQIGRAHV